MKELLSNQAMGYCSSFVNNNNNRDAGTSSITIDNNSRRYAMLSTEWVSAIGEELGMHPLPDPLLKRLAEDASYRLREVLHKCVTRLRHSKRKRLTSMDVNAVITSLCDADPVFGAPESLPEYHTEAKVYVPSESIVNLVNQMNDPLCLTQTNVPFLQESEICDLKLTEARHNYAKRALKTLFNGSQKTFQVLLNDCATNVHLGDEGVIDKLMSIARSMVISNNAQYTRVSTRTCQLIIAIASNSEAVYPYHLVSVDKLTELLLELLLGQSFIHPNLEVLFKECVLKLMLRWPSIADKYIPTLENVLLKCEMENFEFYKKRIMAVELLASIQPLIFFQHDTAHTLSIQNILYYYASFGSVIWERIALAICALMKSQDSLNLTPFIEHYGDSLLPYISTNRDDNARERRDKKIGTLPIIVKSKIRYVEVRSLLNTRMLWDRQTAFPDSTLRGPRREIRFAFAGGRPVPQNNLRRVSLRANYQILRSDLQATLALVASRRLLVIKDKKKGPYNFYNLANVCL
ncbi:PREDICTED: TAF6-like RNA polymerase II p300/CBP-associated factor-associated factor 65 kDa subunit 6L [Atta cephalotes]|uniref:Transcription initiation factor TFIID subunit 6 n=1 Tax=Atta cephalotes TaxID=12957 RepID=A0A158NKD8_ATTCE|nr:PREDICTED: TAF6-like RNA polymerase II p300/CBP-associated factor-associated factor 65 kDa subunit 6L [Atta cephalotes]